MDGLTHIADQTITHALGHVDAASQQHLDLLQGVQTQDHIMGQHPVLQGITQAGSTSFGDFFGPPLAAKTVPTSFLMTETQLLARPKQISVAVGVACSTVLAAGAIFADMVNKLAIAQEKAEREGAEESSSEEGSTSNDSDAESTAAAPPVRPQRRLRVQLTRPRAESPSPEQRTHNVEDALVEDDQEEASGSTSSTQTTRISY